MIVLYRQTISLWIILLELVLFSHAFIYYVWKVSETLIMQSASVKSNNGFLISFFSTTFERKLTDMEGWKPAEC